MSDAADLAPTGASSSTSPSSHPSTSSSSSSSTDLPPDLAVSCSNEPDVEVDSDMNQDPESEAELQAKLSTLLSTIRRRRNGLDGSQANAGARGPGSAQSLRHSVSQGQGRTWKRCRMRVRDWSNLRQQEQAEAQAQAQAEAQVAPPPATPAPAPAIAPAPSPQAESEVQEAEPVETEHVPAVQEESLDPPLPAATPTNVQQPALDTADTLQLPSPPKLGIPLPRDHLILLIPIFSPSDAESGQPDKLHSSLPGSVSEREPSGSVATLATPSASSSTTHTLPSMSLHYLLSP
ncbi:hypothetical protein B0I35DRAFT_410697 [Stachybotrys elegans]|uniref:Uncharacterized protein n=1 Tax=Stachybotrys elegans TaxID=80388 RepID=A0A8K0WPF2_9HYPO|nr:hypothetical protein B0I35DRAFT_410697 [Stachybotrys elegans]